MDSNGQLTWPAEEVVGGCRARRNAHTASVVLRAVNPKHRHVVLLLRYSRYSRPVADSGGTAGVGAEGSCRPCAAAVHTAVAERCIAAEERHTAAAVRPLPAAAQRTLHSTVATAASIGSGPP